MPAAAELPDRLPPVLTVLYLVFNEGYTSTSGELLRTDLCLEAVRLARALADLMPDEPEVIGLLALLLLTEARRPARVGPSGELVVLAEQDRSLWNRELIAEGHDLVRQCLRRDQPGPYQLQAAINAVHTDGPATDWAQVLALYDQLLAHTPTAIVALNRAVAVAEVHGPEQALATIDELDLPGYHLLPATRAELLTRLRPRPGCRRRLRRGDHPGHERHGTSLPPDAPGAADPGHLTTARSARLEALS